MKGYHCFINKWNHFVDSQTIWNANVRTFRSSVSILKYLDFVQFQNFLGSLFVLYFEHWLLVNDVNWRYQLKYQWPWNFATTKSMLVSLQFFSLLSFRSGEWIVYNVSEVYASTVCDITSIFRLKISQNLRKVFFFAFSSYDFQVVSVE